MLALVDPLYNRLGFTPRWDKSVLKGHFLKFEVNTVFADLETATWKLNWEAGSWLMSWVLCNKMYVTGPSVGPALWVTRSVRRRPGKCLESGWSLRLQTLWGPAREYLVFPNWSKYWRKYKGLTWIWNMRHTAMLSPMVMKRSGILGGRDMKTARNRSEPS